MEVTTNTKSETPPLWKQILGAVVGGTLALTLYYGYDYAKPKVTAYLTLPVVEGGRMYDLGAANIADKTTDEGNRKRILSRNLRAAGMLEDNQQNDPAVLDSVNTHSLDIAWPGHDESNPKYKEVMELNTQQGISTAVTEKVEEWSEESVMPDEDMAVPMAIDAAQSNQDADAWENLWGDIAAEERPTVSSVEESTAEGLPDTGFGIGIIAAGAAGGAWGARKKKRS